MCVCAYMHVCVYVFKYIRMCVCECMLTHVYPILYLIY